MLEFRVLGPLEVWDGDRQIALGGRKQRSVLAMLLLSANRFVGTDALIEGVWGEAASEKAGATLQVYVSNLRRALAPDPADRAAAIVGRAGGYQLPVEADQVDLLRFQALAEEGRRLLEEGRPASAAAPLAEALSLWRGPALGDLAFEPFATGVRDALEEGRVALVADRIDVDLALGRHGEVVVEIERLVGEQPLHERHWGQLMLAQYRDGRQADALRAFTRAREVLVEELGIEPGPDLRALEQRILDQDPSLLTTPPSTGPAPPEPATRVRIPRPPTALVGRDSEVDDITTQLGADDVRLLTLTGPGGVGKTRLAIEVARRAEPAFDGVDFVALASIDDPTRLVTAVAQVVGVQESGDGDPVAEIAAALGGQPRLIVLDNLEQVQNAAGPIAALLEAAPSLTLLATSRSPVRVSSEHEYTVPPLGEPGAIALFVERCRAVVPTFELTDANATPVAGICARLDGLPLALELAAARIKILTPADLLVRLDHSLEVLVGGHADLPDRQRTIRATLEWSDALLAPSQQRLLDRLSVFEGPFTLDAAEIVGRDADDHTPMLEGLAELVDNSLVRTVAEGGIVRFRLLQVVRDHGRERLESSGAAEPLRRAHADYWMARCEELALRFDGIEAPAVLEELTVSGPDHRAAFASALAAGEADTAGRIAVALRPYWVTQGRLREGRAWLTDVLAAPQLSAGVRAKALVASGILAYYQDDQDAAVPALRAGLEACRSRDDTEGTALALCFLGVVELTGGEPADARPMADEVLALSRAAGLYETHVMALSMSAMLAALAGDADTEKDLYAERLRLARARHDRTRVADTLNTLAEISLDDGDLVTARTYGEEALRLARGSAKLTTRDALLTLGRIALTASDAPTAAAAFDEALDLCVEFGQPFELAQCLRAVGSTASLAGDAERAAQLFGAAAQAHAVLSGSPFPLERDFAERCDAARAVLGDAAFEAAWQKGELLDLDRAVELARTDRNT